MKNKSNIIELPDFKHELPSIKLIVSNTENLICERCQYPAKLLTNGICENCRVGKTKCIVTVTWTIKAKTP